MEPGSSQGGLQAAANNKIALVNIKNSKNASGEYKNTKKVQQIMSNSNKNVWRWQCFLNRNSPNLFKIATLCDLILISFL